MNNPQSAMRDPQPADLDSPLETAVQSCYKNEVTVGEPPGATLNLQVIKPNPKADAKDKMVD
jgi:hypothetical protein